MFMLVFVLYFELKNIVIAAYIYSWTSKMLAYVVCDILHLFYSSYLF